MMAGTGYSEQQDEGGGSVLDGYVSEYGMPSELGIELVRLDMPEVPVRLHEHLLNAHINAATYRAWCFRDRAPVL